VGKVAKGKLWHRDLNLIAKYGVTEEAYQVLEQVQNHKCKICGIHINEIKQKVFDVDHDHATGRVRGLLCGGCNRGLGAFKDNPTSVLKAIQYLKGNL